MRRSAAAPSSACVEAEALAAWAEGTLPAAEAAVIERHIADCARCQQMVAVFASTEPVPAAVPPQRAWSRWFLPVAAAAAAATVIWIAVPHTGDAPAPVTEMAKAETEAPAVPPEVSAPAPASVADAATPPPAPRRTLQQPVSLPKSAPPP